MTDFTIHTLDTAPEASKPMLEGTKQAFGMIPNLHGVMAESPAILQAYSDAHNAFMNLTNLTVEEKTVIWQAINVRHECHYCVPGHTGLAHMMKVDPAITEALRNETQLPDSKLEALRSFTLAVLEKRGAVDQADLDAFFAEGYENKHVLDVIVGMAQKVMSNYVNHIANTPIDAPFQQFGWERKSAAE